MERGYERLLVEKSNKILFIRINNIAKKNCLNEQCYSDIGRIFRNAAKDDSVTIVVLTGVGDFFSSGNEFRLDADKEDLDGRLKKNDAAIKEMISAIIDFPKVVIALVNGPAIGIGATLAALCDMIWCEEKAYFHTPFTQLGLVPEGCSSYLFPLIVGRSKATELLLLSQKMTAQEALECNFVSFVYKKSDMDKVVLAKFKEFSELPPSSVRVSKSLIRMHEKESLYKAFAAECDELQQRFYSEEFVNALIAFSRRKEKSKL